MEIELFLQKTTIFQKKLIREKCKYFLGRSTFPRHFAYDNPENLRRE